MSESNMTVAQLNNQKVQAAMVSALNSVTVVYALSSVISLAATAMVGLIPTIEVGTSVQYLKKLEEQGRVGQYLLKDAILIPIDIQTAKDFIGKYEYLGYLGLSHIRYGLYWGGELGCVVSFALPPSIQAAKSICGPEYSDKVLLLARGASSGWTPKNTASYTITKALNEIEKNTNFRVIYAYVDPRAGEIGTIYQGLNWIFIGAAPSAPRHEYLAKGYNYDINKQLSTRHIPSVFKSKKAMEKLGIEYEVVEREPRYRYVTFIGDKRERKELRDALLWTPLPYPKRVIEVKICPIVNRNI